MNRASGLARVLLAMLLLAACGVEPQREPQPVPPDRLPSAAPSASVEASVRGRVWGMREQRLVPVFVQLSGTDVPPRVRALLRLAEDEQAATAIARGTRLLSVDRDGDVVELRLSSAFTRTPERQLPLALAQLVFTVTEAAGVERARIEAAGGTVPLVDGNGRVLRRPLARSDFATLTERPATD